jgi:hypothetical protein
MKKLALVVFMTLSTTNLYADPKAPEPKPAETKRVCVEEKDAKGNSREVCKTIKVHKKLEPQGNPKK